MLKILPTFVLSLLLALFGQTSAQTNANSLLLKAEPGTIIWLDNLRYGAVPDTQELTINNLRAGTHNLRARLASKRELSQIIQVKAGAQNTLQVVCKLSATPAEVSFQTAEGLREKGKHKDAIAEYRKALELSKTLFPRARIGLARSLMADSNYEDAITESRRAIKEAATNPALAAEATTVLANTFRSQGLYDEAFVSYRKALTLAHNISPEAHTGLALTHQEENQFDKTVKHLQIAAEQSNDTEPIIYYLLGNLLDRNGQIKLAIAAYEKFLWLEPNSKFAGTTRSLLKQLQRESR